jgi:hypothetical protein
MILQFSRTRLRESRFPDVEAPLPASNIRTDRAGHRCLLSCDDDGAAIQAHEDRNGQGGTRIDPG